MKEGKIRSKVSLKGSDNFGVGAEICDRIVVRVLGGRPTRLHEDEDEGGGS